MSFPLSRLGSVVLCAFMTLPMSAAADLVVLQYHHVDDDTPSATSTSPALFRQQLDRIAELGLEVVPLEEATEQAMEGERQDEQVVALTFDDAYSSVYETAWPLLRERGLPFTIFVNTQAIEQGIPGYMTWAQLREVSASDLVTIGNHTSDHAHLVPAPGESRAALKKRVRASLDNATASLRDNLDLEPRVFAYPYGEYGATAQALVRERDWLGYGQQSGPVGRMSDSSALPRFPASDAYGSLEGLTDKLRAQAFPVDATKLPPSPISANPPELVLPLPQAWDKARLNCFASGQGRARIRDLGGNRVQVQAAEAFDGRRSRYNCTYPAGEGRYYWLSQAWINPAEPES